MLLWIILTKSTFWVVLSRKRRNEDVFENLKELKALVESFGGKVVDILIQRREVHDKGMYIGKGKISEAEEIIKDKKVDIVVLNDIIIYRVE